MNETILYDVFWRQNYSGGKKGDWKLVTTVSAVSAGRAIQIVLQMITDDPEIFLNDLPIDIRVYEESGLWGQETYEKQLRWVAV